MKKVLSVFAILAVLVALTIYTFPSKDAEAQGGYNTNCYMEQGGSKFVAGNGCEFEFQAGSTLDVEAATVSGITTSTLDAQTTGALTVTGASILSGALTTSDTATMAGAVTMNDNLTVDGNVAVTGTLEINDASTLVGAVIANDNLTVDGNVAITGTLEYSGLYPLGYASSGQQIVCGSTTLTGTEEITPAGLTSVTYVVATQVTAPAATGAFLTSADTSATSFTLSSWEADYSEGTTPVEVHYCAIGDE